MSTFLVSFGVVAAAIAGVVYVVLSAPDQPPTIRRQSSGAKPRRRARAEAARQKKSKAARAPAPAPAPTAAASVPPPLPGVPIPAIPGLARPDSDIMRLRVLPAARTTLWVRIRSGVALVVLVAVLGALLALVIGAVILGVALLIRSATG